MREFRSKLEKWIVEHGGGTLAVSKAIGVDQSAVQHWINRHAIPTLPNAEKLIAFSKQKLSLADILEGSRPLYGTKNQYRGD